MHKINLGINPIFMKVTFQCVLITVAARSRARNIFARPWVRVPLGTGESASFPVFVLSCVGRGLATG
jgi:hypothetical protein